MVSRGEEKSPFNQFVWSSHKFYVLHNFSSLAAVSGVSARLAMTSEVLRAGLKPSIE